MKGQLSGCLTSSTTNCSHADISWRPWFLPEERRLEGAEPEEEVAPEDDKTGLGAASEEGGWRWTLAAGGPLWPAVSCAVIGPLTCHCPLIG